MLDEIKYEKKAKLIFQFIEDTERPKALQILNLKKEISKDLPELAFELNDLSLNEYKIYECIISYHSDKKTYSITIYYNKTNYYLCGRGSHSVEIIFCDFIYKSINMNDIFIEYKGKKYSPKENFELLTRKRINFLGIDIKDLKLPSTLQGTILDIDPKFNHNLLITISAANEMKVIGLFQNIPFIDPKTIIDKELLNDLEMKIDTLSKLLEFKKQDNYFQYLDNIGKKDLHQYEESIKSSYEFEKKLSNYFKFYKEKMNDLEIELYDLYSEFMILFPDFEGRERKYGNINLEQYKEQYYFSKSAIMNFCSTIPEGLEKTQKVQLKYAACRCLKTLLFNGYGSFIPELFHFIDYSVEGTIYYEANEFNKKFVDALNEKSEMFLFFLQIDSGSGINLLTKKNTARLSMLSENDIKSHLKSAIPKFGIRLNCNSFFRACTITEVRITCICETVTFQTYLGNNLQLEIDPLCNKRYVLANLLQHEDFGHIKFSINFYSLYDNNIERESELDPVSPIHYYKTKTKEGMIEITKEDIKNGKTIIKGESGLALSSFLTRGNENLISILQSSNVNFKDLFDHPTLYASEDLTELINKLKSLSVSNQSDGNGCLNIKCESFHPIKGFALGFPTTEKFA